MPSVKQGFQFHHAVWLGEALYGQNQAKREVERRPLEHEYKWTDPESQSKTTYAHESFSKTMKRKSMSEDKSKCSFVLVRQHRVLLSSECSVAFKSNKNSLVSKC